LNARHYFKRRAVLADAMTYLAPGAGSFIEETGNKVLRSSSKQGPDIF